MDRGFAIITLANQIARFVNTVNGLARERKPSLTFVNSAYERLYAVSHYTYDIGLIDADTCEAIAEASAQCIGYLKQARKFSTPGDPTGYGKRTSAVEWAKRLTNVQNALRSVANDVTLTTATA